jgi:hypothetical protein
VSEFGFTIACKSLQPETQSAMKQAATTLCFLKEPWPPINHLQLQIYIDRLNWSTFKTTYLPEFMNSTPARLT